MKTRHYYLLAYLLLCALNIAELALIYWRGHAPAIHLPEVSRFWAVLVLGLWVDADSREHPQRIYRPYEFGFLVLMSQVVYLPYYFWRTRRAPGLLILAGMLGLLLFGYVLQALIDLR